MFYMFRINIVKTMSKILIKASVYFAIITFAAHFNFTIIEISKQIKDGVRLILYSTLAALPSQIKLNPNWITGFVDGEGSFMISLRENSKSKKG